MLCCFVLFSFLKILVLSGKICVQLLEFAIFGHTSEGRHWCLNIFPPITFFFLSPWLQGRGRCLVNTAAVIVCTNDMAKMWPWCTCRVAPAWDRSYKMPEEDPSSNGVWYFHLSLCPAGLSTLNFFLSQAVGLVGAAGAGQGDGHVLWVGNGKGLQTVSKAKGRSDLKCSSTTLPNHLAWFMLNKSVIYAQATCSST